jgi:putative acetyltransferase
MTTIAIESPDQPDVQALIDALDQYQTALYPAESNHLLDIAALQQSHVLFAVARDQFGNAQGCGAVVMNREYGEIKRMFVRPESRGRGIAAQLLSFLEARAAAGGCHQLMLETGIRQPEAIALYRRFGYTQRGPFNGYGDDPLSLFMEKTLGAAG